MSDFEYGFNRAIESIVSGVIVTITLNNLLQVLNIPSYTKSILLLMKRIRFSNHRNNEIRKIPVYRLFNWMDNRLHNIQPDILIESRGLSYRNYYSLILYRR